MKTVIAFRPCGTSIPYFQEGDDPTVKHEYIDLRAEPNRVAELPEIVLVDGLRDMLLAINGPDTIFRTYGSRFDLDYNGESELGYSIYSYVHVAFANLERCKQIDDYYRVIGRVSEVLHADEAFAPDEADTLELTWDVEGLTIDNVDYGIVLGVECSVLANTEADARNNWLTLMQRVTDALVLEKLEALPQPAEAAGQDGGPIEAAPDLPVEGMDPGEPVQ